MKETDLQYNEDGSLVSVEEYLKKKEEANKKKNYENRNR